MKPGENALAIRKTQGSIGELIVAGKVGALGWRILFPFGENARYDFVAEKEGRFVRVQVKYVTPKKGALVIRCQSCNNWSVKSYTEKDIDCLAVYDAVHDNVYFIPVACINKTMMSLRLEPSKNRQLKGIQKAEYFVDFPF